MKQDNVSVTRGGLRVPNDDERQWAGEFLAHLFDASKRAESKAKESYMLAPNDAALKQWVYWVNVMQAMNWATQLLVQIGPND